MVQVDVGDLNGQTVTNTIQSYVGCLPGWFKHEVWLEEEGAMEQKNKSDPLQLKLSSVPTPSAITS